MEVAVFIGVAPERVGAPRMGCSVVDCSISITVAYASQSSSTGHVGPSPVLGASRPPGRYQIDVRDVGERKGSFSVWEDLDFNS